MSKSTYSQEHYDKIANERNQLALENFQLKEKLKTRDIFENQLVEKCEEYKDKVDILYDENKKLKDFIDDMAQEQIAEMKEHQEAMKVADAKIKELRENGLANRILKEKMIPAHCLEQYEKYENKIEELEEKVKQLEMNNGELVSLIDTIRYDDPKIEELKQQLRMQCEKLVGKFKNFMESNDLDCLDRCYTIPVKHLNNFLDSLLVSEVLYENN